MKKKTVAVVKTRNPFAGQKGRRTWGSGSHGNKKAQSNKRTCRGKVVVR